MHSITLQTAEATVVDGDVLGRIGFAASAETGSEALKVAAKIEAVAEETFDASNNATEMVFYLAGDGDAAAKMTLSSAGNLTLAGNLLIPNGGNIGSASDTNAIAIASDGVVTMDQIPVFSAGINVSGGTIAGTLATAAQTNITTVGTLVGLTVQKNAGQLALFERITGNGNAYITVDSTNDSDNHAEAQLRLKTGVDGDSRIYFGDTDDIDRGCICYDHAAENLMIKTGNAGSNTGSTTAITIDTNQTTTFAGSINQGITSATEDATVVIDLSDGNYFNITLGADVTDIDFTNGTDGQRFLIRFTQPGGANHSIAYNAVTHDQDGGGSPAAVTIKWAGGITPTMTRTNAKADTYGFIINDENAFDGFIVGQNI